MKPVSRCRVLEDTVGDDTLSLMHLTQRSAQGTFLGSAFEDDALIWRFSFVWAVAVRSWERATLPIDRNNRHRIIHMDIDWISVDQRLLIYSHRHSLISLSFVMKMKRWLRVESCFVCNYKQFEEQQMRKFCRHSTSRCRNRKEKIQCHWHFQGIRWCAFTSIWMSITKGFETTHSDVSPLSLSFSFFTLSRRTVLTMNENYHSIETRRLSFIWDPLVTSLWIQMDNKSPFPNR